MNKYLTASTLYDYTQCPHRVWRDRFGPQAEKSQESNPFIELLWEKGVSHEKDVVSKLQLVDLSSTDKTDQFNKTLEAMRNKVPLIYHGYLQYETYSGEPDLLRLEPDGTYIPIDIKSGSGFEGTNEDSDENGKLKKHYALQIAHYCELIAKLGFGSKHRGIILDSKNEEVLYDLDLPQGVKTPMTWWQLYEQTRYEVSRLITNQTQNKPAYSSLCKLCPWYQSCKKWCLDTNDPTMIAYLGRSGRDTLVEDLELKDAKDLCSIDVSELINRKQKDKSFLPRIGEKQLIKFKFRVQINYELKTPQFKPFPPFPKVNHELFFDIEDDPTQEFVYLHGVYERTPEGERFLDDFVAADNTREAEKEAWTKFVRYVQSLPKGDFCLYYYSKHERTTYREMQKMYPDVIDINELETWFVPPIGIDLYFDYIFKYTEWPLPSYSLKEIAHYLNFNWRDKTPSGALSIQWFNEYLEDKDPAKLKRILEYNGEDCKATMVIKDYLDSVKTE
jgi:predicted RecB family nuclease